MRICEFFFSTKEVGRANTSQTTKYLRLAIYDKNGNFNSEKLYIKVATTKASLNGMAGMHSITNQILAVGEYSHESHNSFDCTFLVNGNVKGSSSIFGYRFVFDYTGMKTTSNIVVLKMNVGEELPATFIKNNDKLIIQRIQKMNNGELNFLSGETIRLREKRK